jgi:hypothetical protein
VPVGTGVDTVPVTLVATAKAMWLARGLPDAAAAARLAHLTVTVADPDGRLLAETSGTDVAIDRDAAAHSWFICPIPTESIEFAGIGTVLQARSGGPVDGRTDC